MVNPEVGANRARLFLARLVVEDCPTPGSEVLDDEAKVARFSLRGGGQPCRMRCRWTAPGVP